MLAYLTAIFTLMVPAADVAASGEGKGLLGDSSLREAGLTTYWEANLPLTERDSIADAFLVDESLYVVAASGTVFAIQADVGLIRWAAKVAERSHTVFRPAHIRTADGDGPVVIPTVADFHIINRFTGETITSFKPPFAPGGPVIGHEERLFAGSLGETFNSFLWVTLQNERPVRLWEVRVGGPITAAPVFDDVDSLLFASEDGVLYSCSASDKTYRWSFRTGGAIRGDVALDDNGAYVASLDRSLYKVDLENGRLIWRLRLPAPLEEGPVVASGTVFQYCPDVGLLAIDPDSGLEKWRDRDGRRLAAHIPRQDVLFAGEGQLHIVDHETGKLNSAVDVHPVRLAVTNALTDSVYLLAPDGRVVCLRPSGVPYLRPREVDIARARLNLAPDREAPAAKPDERSVEVVDPLENDPLRSRRDVGR